MFFYYACLAAAILLEVTGTMLLPVSQNFSRPIPTFILICCYAGAFYMLTFAVQAIPLAVVYATWSGLGVFAIAILGYLFYHHALPWHAMLGLGMIIGGVVLVQLK